VTAAVDLRVLLSKQKLRAVFNKLDKDKSDSIDKDEIK
jgi:Ca2+-binding EF-hand superfamily protein